MAPANRFAKYIVQPDQDQGGGTAPAPAKKPNRFAKYVEQPAAPVAKAPPMASNGAGMGPVNPIMVEMGQRAQAQGAGVQQNENPSIQWKQPTAPIDPLAPIDPKNIALLEQKRQRDNEEAMAYEKSQRFADKQAQLAASYEKVNADEYYNSLSPVDRFRLDVSNAVKGGAAAAENAIFTPANTLLAKIDPNRQAADFIHEQVVPRAQAVGQMVDGGRLGGFPQAVTGGLTEWGATTVRNPQQGMTEAVDMLEPAHVAARGYNNLVDAGGDVIDGNVTGDTNRKFQEGLIDLGTGTLGVIPAGSATVTAMRNAARAPARALEEQIARIAPMADDAARVAPATAVPPTRPAPAPVQPQAAAQGRFFDPKGDPVDVEIVAQGQNGGVIVRTKDGREVLVGEEILTRSARDPSYVVEWTGTGKPVSQMTDAELAAAKQRADEIIKARSQAGQSPYSYVSDRNAIIYETKRRASGSQAAPQPPAPVQTATAPPIPPQPPRGGPPVAAGAAGNPPGVPVAQAAQTPPPGTLTPVGLGPAEQAVVAMERKAREALWRAFQNSGVDRQQAEAMIRSLNDLPPGQNSMYEFELVRRFGQQFPRLKANLQAMGRDWAITIPKDPRKGAPNQVMDDNVGTQIKSEGEFIDSTAQSLFGQPATDTLAALETTRRDLSGRYNALLNPANPYGPNINRMRGANKAAHIQKINGALEDLTQYLQRPEIMAEVPEWVRSRVMLDIAKDMRERGGDFLRLLEQNSPEVARLVAEGRPLRYTPELWKTLTTLYPTQVGHTLQSAYGRAIREGLSSGDVVARTAAEELIRLRGGSKVRTNALNPDKRGFGLLHYIEEAVPGYREVRKQYGDIMGAEEAVFLPESFFRIANNDVELDQWIKAKNDLSPAQQAALESGMTTQIQQALRKRHEMLSPEELDQVDALSTPNLTRLSEQPVLNALEKAFGAKGKQMADAIRAASTRTDRVRSIHPNYGPRTAPNQEAVKNAGNIYGDPLGSERNVIDNMAGSLAAAGGMSALNPMTAAAAPVLLTASAARGLYNLWKRGKRLNGQETEQLADFFFRSRRPDLAEQIRGPRGPSVGDYAGAVARDAAIGAGAGYAASGGDPNAAAAGAAGGAAFGVGRARVRNARSQIKPPPAGPRGGNRLRPGGNPPPAIGPRGTPRIPPGDAGFAGVTPLAALIGGSGGAMLAPDVNGDGTVDAGERLAAAILGTAGGAGAGYGTDRALTRSRPAGNALATSGVPIKTPAFDGPGELRRLLGEPSKYLPWRNNPSFKQLEAQAGEVVGEAPVKLIIPGQSQIRHNYKDVPARYGDNPEDLPQLVKEGGRYYIRDGTHRIAAQVDGGATTIKARIIDLDAASPNALKSGPAKAPAAMAEAPKAPPAGPSASVSALPERMRLASARLKDGSTQDVVADVFTDRGVVVVSPSWPTNAGDDLADALVGRSNELRSPRKGLKVVGKDYSPNGPQATQQRKAWQAEKGPVSDATFYHGTTNVFDQFEGPTWLSRKREYTEPFAWATKDEIANGIATPTVIEAHIRGRLKTIGDKEIEQLGYHPEKIEALKRQGFDGVESSDQVLIFDPKDIRRTDAKVEASPKWSSQNPQEMADLTKQVADRFIGLSRNGDAHVLALTDEVDLNSLASYLEGKIPSSKQLVATRDGGEIAIVSKRFLRDNADQFAAPTWEPLYPSYNQGKGLRPAPADWAAQKAPPASPPVKPSGAPKPPPVQKNAFPGSNALVPAAAGAGGATYGWNNPVDANEDGVIDDQDRMITATTLGLGGLTVAGVARTRGRNPNRSQLNTFGGVNAKTADRAALARAQQMEASGADRNAIWDETGWFKGVDGKWRFEIDDSGAKIGSEAALVFGGSRAYPGSMKDVLDHPELYKAYPEMADDPAMIKRTPQESGVFEGATRNSGAFGPDLESVRSTMLHEAGGHGVQQREGFASGGSPNTFTQQKDAELARDAMNWRRELAAKRKEMPKADWIAVENAVVYDYQKNGIMDWLPSEQARNLARDTYNNPDDQLQELVKVYGLDKQVSTSSPMTMYRRTAGEAEARNVQTRDAMRRRGEKPGRPWETQDVPDDQQIVRFGGGKAESRKPPPAQSGFGGGNGPKAPPVKKPPGYGKVRIAPGVEVLPPDRNALKPNPRKAGKAYPMPASESAELIAARKELRDAKAANTRARNRFVMRENREELWAEADAREARAMDNVNRLLEEQAAKRQKSGRARDAYHATKDFVYSERGGLLAGAAGAAGTVGLVGLGAALMGGGGEKKKPKGVLAPTDPAYFMTNLKGNKDNLAAVQGALVDAGLLADGDDDGNWGKRTSDAIDAWLSRQPDRNPNLPLQDYEVPALLAEAYGGYQDADGKWYYDDGQPIRFPIPNTRGDMADRTLTPTEVRRMRYEERIRKQKAAAQ